MQNRSENLLIYGLALLVVLTAWLFVPALANAFAIKAHIVILGGFVLFLAWTASPGPRTLRLAWNARSASFILLILAASWSAGLAPNANLAASAWLELLAFVLLVIGLLSLEQIDTAQRHLETALIIAATGVALFALKQFLLPAWLDPGFHALGKMKIYSSLGNPNLAALMILPAVPLAAFRARRAIHAWRLAYAAIVFVLFTGLLATQSRHALLALMVTAVLALLWLFPSRRRLLVALILGAAVTVGILLWIEIPSSLLHSIQGRWFIWNTAGEMLWQHPWAGVGLGHFGLLHPDYQAQLFATGQFENYYDNAALIEEAHNQFLHWGATTGGFGLLGFVALCAAVLQKGWRSALLRERAPQLYLALLASLVAMLFVATLAYTATALVFWLLLALAWRHIESPSPGIPLPAALRPIILIAVAGMLLPAGLWAWRDLRGGHYEARGDIHMEERDLWSASRAYQDGLSACPACTSLRKKQANVLFLTGQWESALLELRAAQRGSGDVALRILEGEILARLQRLDEAVEVYRRIRATFPKMVSAHFILGQIFMLQGKRDQAALEFTRVLEIEPSPYNLNLTSEKIVLQKEIARQALRELGAAKVGAP